MSGNDSELPDGSTRLADREASEFQQRQQRQQQRQLAVEERRQQAAEQLGLERADIQPEFDDRGNVAEFGVTPEGQAEVEADTREEIAGQSEFITPDDVSVDVSSAGVEEAAIAEDRRDDIAERVSEDVASDADFLEEQDVSVSVSATGIENIDVEERAAVRRRATEQAIESDPFVDSADDVDVSVEETESGEFNVEAERAASAEQAADAVEQLSELDFRLSPTGPSPSSVTLQDQFSQLTQPNNVDVIRVGGSREVINFRDRTSISPTFEDASGEASSEFFFGLRDLDRETRSELTIADLGQDPEFLQEGIEDVRRQTRRDAIQDELDEAGVDDLGASVSLDGDVVLQDEQNRTGSGRDIGAALEELQQNQLDSARFDAAQQIDSDTPGVDVRSDDLQRSGGEFSLDAETRQAVEAAQQEQARRDAADRFDSRLDGVDVGSDDVQLGEQGGETIAELDDATRDAVLEQQRTQARQDAAEQFDAETGLDVGTGDVEVQQTDEGFEAALDDETEDELLERRQDIAADITPETSPAFAGEQRFPFGDDILPDDLDSDARIETSTERVSVAGSGPVASTDLPGTDQNLGGLLDDAAAAFDDEITDPAADIAEDIGEADFPVGPAGGIEGSEGRGQLARDFTTSAVGAFNLPGAAAAGVRIGDEIGQRVEPVGAPGGGITLSDPEQAEQDLEIAQDAGAAAGEFAADNPGRTGAFVAGGLAAGLAAGGAINLGRRGVSRGVGVGRRAIGDVEIDDARPGAFLRDERGMAGGGGRMLERSVEEIEVDEFDTSSGRARAQELEIDDAGELAREQARLVERDRMPPREAFESDDAFEEALDARVARRLEQDTDDLVAPEARTTTDTAIDTRPRTSAGAFAPEGTALSAAAFASRAADADIGFAGAGSGGETTSAGTFDGRTTDADTAFATGALDTETTSASAFDTELEPITATGLQSDTATDVDQAFDQPTALDEPFDQPTATDQAFDQPTALDTRSDLDDALATDQAFDQVFDVDTTRTTTTTRTTGRGRLRPPGLPDLEASDGGRRDPLGAIGANFRNPTRTLSEADDLVTEIGGEFDGPR